MKKLSFALIFATILFSSVAINPTYAMEDPPFFGGHTQWNQAEKLRAELFGEYIITSNIPQQYGPDKPYGNSSARHREGLQLQYRLLEDPAIGKIELGLHVRIDTRDDAPDSLLRGPIEVAYTLPKGLSDRFRVRLGFADQMNIGNKAGATREIGSTYVGADVKIFDSAQWLVSFNSIYHFSSTIPSVVLDRYDGERRHPLRAEIGPQVYWRAHPVLTFMAAPSLYFNDNFKPTMAGVQSGIQYDFGKHLFSPDNPASRLSWHFGTEYKMNISDSKDAFGVFMGLRFRF